MDGWQFSKTISLTQLPVASVKRAELMGNNMPYLHLKRPLLSSSCCLPLFAHGDSEEDRSDPKITWVMTSAR